MVESVAKQVKSDQATDGTPEGTPNGIPDAAPDATADTAPEAAPTEKRAGLMAAIRTAMREIGEDVGGARPASAPDAGLVEIHPDLPRVNPSLVFGATMALWHPPRFTARALLDTLNEVLEGTGAVAAFDPEMKQADTQPRFSLLKRRLAAPPSAILRVNGLRTLVGGGDKPAFAGKALEDRVNPALWAEGVARLSQSRGHVMIADAHPPDPSDPDLNYDRAVAVTVTAAAVSLLTDASGIIWHPAGNATPPDVIPDFVQSLIEGIAPLPLWLRWLMLPADPGRNPGAATRGLEALLGRELEIVPNDFGLEKTVGDLFEIAHAQVRLGRAPGDGTQVGTRARTWYHAVHAPRGTVSEAPVFRLTPISEYTGERPV